MGSLERVDDKSPLRVLIEAFVVSDPDMVEITEKVLYWLRRGANVKIRGAGGETCLHLILRYYNDRSVWKWLQGAPTWIQYCKNRREDAENILIALVNAGADVFACDDEGISVSEFAHDYYRTKLWVKVLKTCGKDPWEVLAKGGVEIIGKGSDDKPESDMESEFDTDEDEGEIGSVGIGNGDGDFKPDVVGDDDDRGAGGEVRGNSDGNSVGEDARENGANMEPYIDIYNDDDMGGSGGLTEDWARDWRAGENDKDMDLEAGIDMTAGWV